MAEAASEHITTPSHLEDRPRVLVVDDEPGVRQVIRVNLVMQGHDVVEAKNGAQALKFIDENGIDLVILDLMMPKVSGWDVLQTVRERRGSRAMPIIVLSAVTTEDAKLKAFDLGAADYIVKPFAVGELLARVNRTLHERKEKQVLAEFSITDWVTGLFNRRYLELRLPQEVSRAHRYGRALSGLFFEIDQLPWLLEDRGPQFVDGILQEVATLVRGETRACDVLFRYDGDYFVALLPDTPLAGGVQVADRIRRRMLETEWHQEVGLSGTFGVVELQEGEDAAKFLTRAEDALLNAKRYGGNAVWPTGTEMGGSAPVSEVEHRPVEEFPVEEGPAQPLLQQDFSEAGQLTPQQPDLGELQSSATQRIDPSLLAQVRQDLQASSGEPATEPVAYQSDATYTEPSQLPQTTPAWAEPNIQSQQWQETQAQPEQWAEVQSGQWSEPGVQPGQWQQTQAEPEVWADQQYWEGTQSPNPEEGGDEAPPYQSPPHYPTEQSG